MPRNIWSRERPRVTLDFVQSVGKKNNKFTVIVISGHTLQSHSHINADKYTTLKKQKQNKKQPKTLNTFSFQLLNRQVIVIVYALKAIQPSLFSLWWRS